MARHLFMVLTSPTPGMEDEFNEWYSNTHLADVLKLRDYQSAQRFVYVPRAPDDEPLRRYLAIYETEGDDLAVTKRQLMEAIESGAMPFSPAIDQSQTIVWFYEPITERMTS